MFVGLGFEKLMATNAVAGEGDIAFDPFAGHLRTPRLQFSKCHRFMAEDPPEVQQWGQVVIGCFLLLR